MFGGAAGVHAEHLAALLQPLVDGAPQARQQHLTLSQTVDINRKSSQVLREDQLQDTGTAQYTWSIGFTNTVVMFLHSE